MEPLQLFQGITRCWHFQKCCWAPLCPPGTPQSPPKGSCVLLAHGAPSQGFPALYSHPTGDPETPQGKGTAAPTPPGCPQTPRGGCRDKEMHSWEMLLSLELFFPISFPEYGIKSLPPAKAPIKYHPPGNSQFIQALGSPNRTIPSEVSCSVSHKFPEKPLWKYLCHVHTAQTHKPPIFIQIKSP